jgi:hypothetical protein
MMKLLAIVTVCLLFNFKTYACSCLAQEPSGFVQKYSQILPPNAKGVLFYRDPVHFYFRDDKKIKTLPLSSKDFQLKDKTTKKTVPTRVVQLKDAEHTWKESSAGLNKNASKSEQENFARSVGLFRVEPLEGFVAKHVYEIKYIGQPKLESPYSHTRKQEYVSHDSFATRESLEIEISAKPLDLKKLDQIVYKSAGAPKVEELFVVSNSGSCSTRIKAAVEKIKLEMDSDLNEYAESFLQFTSIRQGKEAFRPWKFQSAACSPSRYGSIEAHKYFRVCPKGRNSDKDKDYSDIVIDEVSASWGFLEVEDKLHASQSLPTDFATALAQGCQR